MTGEFFTATHRGRPVVIGRATAEDLDVIAKPLQAVERRDVLENWTLVAIRHDGQPVAEIHALGWRPGLQNTWVTSPLTGVDITACEVATWSGHVYVLGQPDDGPDLDPELRAHLVYALSRWGFDDVQG